MPSALSPTTLPINTPTHYLLQLVHHSEFLSILLYEHIRSSHPVLPNKLHIQTIMSDASNQPERAASLTPEMIDFASKMYEAARQGDVSTFEQALPAGLPPNLTNDKGDTLV